MIRHLFNRYYVALFTYNYNCGGRNFGYLHPLARGNISCSLPLRCCSFLFPSFELSFLFSWLSRCKNGNELFLDLLFEHIRPLRRAFKSLVLKFAEDTVQQTGLLIHGF